MIVLASGPSGVGKKCVTRKMVQLEPSFKLSCSWTTRPCRDGEVGGDDYHFVTPEQFNQAVADGEILESDTFAGHLYGTHRSSLPEGGGATIFEVDYRGAKKLATLFKNQAHSFFLLPPSFEELERRLRTRGREKDEEEIRSRLITASREVHQASGFHWWIVNEDVVVSACEIAEVVVNLQAGKIPHPRYRDPEILDKVLSTFPNM